MWSFIAAILAFFCAAAFYLVVDSMEVDIKLNGAIDHPSRLMLVSQARWLPAITRLPEIDFEKVYACCGDSMPGYTRCLRITGASFYLQKHSVPATCLATGSCRNDSGLLPMGPTITAGLISPWVLQHSFATYTRYPDPYLPEAKSRRRLKGMALHAKPLFVRLSYAFLRSNGNNTFFATSPGGNTMDFALVVNGTHQFLTQEVKAWRYY